MSTIVILGAGASAGSEFSEVPVIKTFFAKSRELGVTQRPEYEPLWQFLQETLAISIDRLPELERHTFATIESIYSQVTDIVSDANNEASTPLRLMELFIYDTLGESTRQYGNNRCSFHERLFAALNPSAIITFNYDLIADKALGSLHEGWERNFQLRFDMSFDGERFVPIDRSRSSEGRDLEDLLKKFERQRNRLEPKAGFPEYLKLHGSLNWYYDVTRREMRRSRYRWQSVLTLYYVPLQFAFGTGRIYQRRAARDYLLSTLQSSPPGPLPDEGAELHLAIVPPVLQKEFPSFIQAQWDVAQKELKRADRIVFVGYSIPQLDLAADRMFRTCYAQSEHRAQLCVEVINRNAGILDKVRSIYPGASVQHVANSLREYVDRFA